MWAQVERILRQATGRIGDNIAEFLPGAVVALTILLLTLVIATIVRLLLGRGLRALDFDRRADQLGLSGLAGVPPPASPAGTVSRVAYWTIVALGLLVSLTALNAAIPSALALSAFVYVPHLLAAVLILVLGAIAARFMARSVLIGAVNMRLQFARLMSLAVKWLVMLVAIAMALDHLGIGRTILQLAFGILFGGIVLAGALAVGLGARDVVGRALERRLKEPARREDKVDHV
jgi:hypothetical protein